VEVKYLYGLMGCRGGGTGRLIFRDVKVPRRMWWEKFREPYAVFKYHDDTLKRLENGLYD